METGLVRQSGRSGNVTCVAVLTHLREIQGYTMLPEPDLLATAEVALAPRRAVPTT